MIQGVARCLAGHCKHFCSTSFLAAAPVNGQDQPNLQDKSSQLHKSKLIISAPENADNARTGEMGATHYWDRGLKFWVKLKIWGQCVVLASSGGGLWWPPTIGANWPPLSGPAGGSPADLLSGGSHHIAPLANISHIVSDQLDSHNNGQQCLVGSLGHKV